MIKNNWIKSCYWKKNASLILNVPIVAQGIISENATYLDGGMQLDAMHLYDDRQPKWVTDW